MKKTAALTRHRKAFSIAGAAALLGMLALLWGPSSVRGATLHVTYTGCFDCIYFDPDQLDGECVTPHDGQWGEGVYCEYTYYSRSPAFLSSSDCYTHGPQCYYIVTSGGSGGSGGTGGSGGSGGCTRPAGSGCPASCSSCRYLY